MAVIKDVAKKTGLSISTISKYMNGNRVRKENQLRIEAAIQELGYQPNELARGLRTAKTHMIGVLLYRLRDTFSAKIAGNIERYLRKRGYSIILWSHEGNRDEAIKGIQYLMRNQVEGLIVEPIPGEEKIFEEYVREKIPVVSVDRILDTKKFDSVCANTMLGIYEGTEYLISMGHKKIGMIAAGRDAAKGMSSGIERTKGFLRAMEDYELEIRKEWIAEGDFSVRSGYNGMVDIWNQKERPTAIVCANYNMCVGMMKALHDLKVKVPDMLSVVSMDDMIFSEICSPRLTAIRQPVDEIAEKTSELILKRIAGDYSDHPKNLKIHTTFVERETVSVVEQQTRRINL